MFDDTQPEAEVEAEAAAPVDPTPIIERPLPPEEREPEIALPHIIREGDWGILRHDANVPAYAQGQLCHVTRAKIDLHEGSPRDKMTPRGTYETQDPKQTFLVQLRGAAAVELEVKRGDFFKVRSTRMELGV